LLVRVGLGVIIALAVIIRRDRAEGRRTGRPEGSRPRDQRIRP
jgi:hypothetical protein